MRMSMLTVQVSELERLRQLGWRAPFITTGFANVWPAFARWDTDYLRSTVGTRSIDVEAYPTPMFSPKGGEADFPKRRMTIADFLERSENVAAPGEWLYAAQVSLGSELPALTDDISAPPWVSARPYATGFWMGRQGTGSRLHYDPYDNVIGVVRGVKRFSMFPPGQFAAHYPYGAFSRWAHFSQVDIDAPDRRRFPHPPPEGRLDFRLAAGEALSVPHGWWHQVVNEEDSVAVNFFYEAPFRAWLSRPLLRYGAGMASRLGPLRATAAVFRFSAAAVVRAGRDWARPRH
jgi:lysine-specific demethylase 8